MTHAAFEGPSSLPVEQMVGQSLFAARTERGLALEDVANALLLSTRQIEELECGKSQLFYNTNIYHRCLDKYAALLALDIVPSSLLAEQTYTIPEEKFAVTTVVPSESPLKINCSAKPRAPLVSILLKQKWVLFGAALSVVAVGIFDMVMYKTQPESPSASLTKLAVMTASEEAAPVTISSDINADKPGLVPLPENTKISMEPPAISPETNTTKNQTIRMQFNDNCWVQTVDQLGHQIEKTYKSGDVLEIDPSKLQALIIGDYHAIALATQNSGNEIKLKPFVNPGSDVARIIGQDVRNLGKVSLKKL